MSEKQEESVEKLSDDELTMLRDLRSKVEFATLTAEKQTAQAKVLDLEYRNAIQNVFLLRGLTLNDRVDLNTGAIVRAPKKAEE